MTLQQSTQALLAAIETEDLAAAAQALNARALLIAQASATSLDARVAEEALEGGEQARVALEHLKQSLVAECGRVAKLQAAFATSPSEPNCVLHG
jgi:hypothetical protein